MTMTYNSLVTQIMKYANREDVYFTNSIPYFIENAQQRINREAKDIGQEATDYGHFKKGNPLLEKPSNWNKTISIQYSAETITDLTTLYHRSYEFCVHYWPNPTTEQGAPLFYADFNLTNAPYGAIFITPTPDDKYRYQLVYLTRPALINTAIQDNWLTEHAPDLLFYASMVEAMPFLKDDTRLPLFESLYTRALQSLNKQTIDRYTDRASVRDKD